MLDLSQIEAASRKQARISQRQGPLPKLLEKDDLRSGDSFFAFVRTIPHLGDRKTIRRPYGLRAFHQVDVRKYLPDYPYKWFFVDSSGFGRPGEPALTLQGFYDLLATLREQEGVFALGIVEVGEYQVQIALYEAL